jgi:hypothetical protein
MPDNDDGELDEIIRKQKPGFVRKARRARPDALLSGSTEETAPTPDVDVLRKKARESASRPSQSKGGGSGDASQAAQIFRKHLVKEKPVEDNLLGPNDDADDVDIVGVTPESGDSDAEGSPKEKAVVTSRSKGRIIGEQG